MAVIDRISGVETAVAIKAPVRAATTANITLSGTQTIDGIALAAGDRVLVKNQTSAVDNGIWEVSTGAWSRTEDFNGFRDVVKGTEVYVTSGTANADLRFAQTVADPVIGSTSLSFTAISGTVTQIAEDARDAALVAAGEAEDSATAAATSAEEAEASATAAASTVALGEAVAFSRTEMVARNIAAAVDTISIIVGQIPGTNVRHLRYIADADGTALTTNGGTRKWSPLGEIEVQHFGENITSGTTDMSAAILAAVEWAVLSSSGISTGAGARDILFTCPTYRMDSTVKLTNGYDHIRFKTTGSSEILSTVEGPAFQVNDDLIFSGNDTAGALPIWGVEFHGLRFRASDITSEASIAIRSGLAPDLKIINCDFVNFYISLDWHRQNTAYVDHCRFSAQQRTASEPARAFILQQGVYDSGATNTPGGGIHIGTNEWFGNANDYSGLLSGIEIKAVDGWYFEGANHFNHYATAGLLISPDATQQNNRITDIENRGTLYFDGEVAAGARGVSIVGSVSYGGAAGSGLLQNIRLDGMFCRGGGLAAYGVVVNVTDAGGFISQYGGIEGLSICHGEFAGHTLASISLRGVNESRIPCQCPIIHSNKFTRGRQGGTTGTVSYISTDTDGISCIGNVFDEELVTPARSVSLNVSNHSGSRITFAHNDLTKSTGTVEAYLINKAADANWIIGPNLTPNGKVDENTNETEITIADDAVGLVDLPDGRFAAMVVVHADGRVTGVQNAHCGMFRADAGSTPGAVSVQAGANFTPTTGTLTGTTGTDGNTTVSPNSSQQIQVENRSGASRTYQVVML